MTPPRGMRILTLDIETSPSVADVWSLWKTNISVDQLRERGGVICFAAKWYGEKDVIFSSTFHNREHNMIRTAWKLLDEADAVVHFNGTTFDIPHLHRAFLLRDLTPPSTFKQIDLLQTVRRQFNFPSNRLQNVSIELGIGKKVKHEGHDLWVRCLQGDEKAWATMRRYNMQDVVLTEKLYDKLLPWIPSHPHHGLYSLDPEENRCGRCNKKGTLHARGTQKTSVGAFPRYRCMPEKGGCGGWNRGKHAVARVDIRPI